MKKIMMSLIALAVTASVLLTGCAVTEEKAVEMYKASFEKMKEIESYRSDVNISMDVMIGEQPMSFTVKGESAVSEKNMAAHKFDVSAMGQETATEIYQKGDDFYTSVPGEDKYIKTTLKAAGFDYSQLFSIGDGEMSEYYLAAIDKAGSISFSEEEKGKIKVAFDFAQEDIKAMEEKIVGLLKENALEGIEDQLKANLDMLPVPESMMGLVLKAYEMVFSNVKVDDISNEVILDKKGYSISQNSTIAMHMDFSSLFDLLKLPIDSGDKEKMHNIRMTLSVSSNLYDVNKDVAIEFPEFTAENTIEK